MLQQTRLTLSSQGIGEPLLNKIEAWYNWLTQTALTRQFGVQIPAPQPNAPVA